MVCGGAVILATSDGLGARGRYVAQGQRSDAGRNPGSLLPATWHNTSWGAEGGAPGSGVRGPLRVGRDTRLGSTQRALQRTRHLASPSKVRRHVALTHRPHPSRVQLEEETAGRPLQEGGGGGRRGETIPFPSLTRSPLTLENLPVVSNGNLITCGRARTFGTGA